MNKQISITLLGTGCPTLHSERFPTKSDEGAYFPFACGSHTCMRKFFASYLFKNITGHFVSEVNFKRGVEDVQISTVPIPFSKSDMIMFVD